MNSLVLMHVGTNTGYAIAPLESLFYRVCTELANGEPTTVHFAFRDQFKGRPTSIPANAPVITFNSGTPSRNDLRFLREYVRKYEITFALAFDMQPVSPVFRALRDGGVSTILSYWGAPISGKQPAWRVALKRLHLHLSPARCDGMIFESRAMADLATHGRGVPKQMIDIVPLGIDVTQFSASPNSYVYDALMLPTDRKVVVYAGHMEERKGVRYLVKAAIELLGRRGREDVSFLLFGNKDDESEPYRSLFVGTSIESHIVFGGYRDDLARVFPGCYLGVIPSSGWDSFPRTSMELAACGLPLIVTRLGGLPECVSEGETGLVVPPADHIALADAIERLLDDPELARKMSVAGRARCEREYTLKVQQQRLGDVCRKRLR